MRILFVMNGFLRGGAEMHTWQLANALSARNVPCQIVGLRETPDPVIPDWNHVPIALIGGNQLFDFAAIHRLANFIKEFEPSVIVAVNQRPLFYAQIAKLIASNTARLTCIFHSTPELRDRKPYRAHLSAAAWSRRKARLKGLKDRLLSVLYRPFFARTDALAYVSRNQRAAWEKIGYTSRHATVIYNGVDTEVFSPDSISRLRDDQRSALGFAPDDLVVGLCAEFRPEKNHFQLVDAVQALREEGVRAKALFVGDGPTAPEVARYVIALGLGEHIVFVGHKSDVRPFLAAFDVGVLCSISETFSLAALEILATGIPVVATETGGTAEMIRHNENGFLFPVGETQALVRYLAVLTDRQRRARMGSHAASEMKERFDLRPMIDIYADLFQEVTAEAKAGAVDPAPSVALIPYLGQIAAWASLI